MADVKIADLLSATTVADTDLFIVEDNADTKKITKANLVGTLGINGKAPTVHTHSMSQITDYEQGTWTPVNASQVGQIGTWSTYTGRYIRTGNVVVATVEITGTGLGYGRTDGYTQLTGLPFNVRGGAGGTWASGSIAQGLAGITLGTGTSLWLMSPQSINTTSTTIWASVTYLVA